VKPYGSTFDKRCEAQMGIQTDAFKEAKDMQIRVHHKNNVLYRSPLGNLHKGCQIFSFFSEDEYLL